MDSSCDCRKVRSSALPFAAGISLLLVFLPSIGLASPEAANDSRLKDSKIAFVAKKLDCDYQICTINCDGTGFVKVTSNSHICSSPAWSPDGKKIAFSYQETLSRWEIYTIGADGKNQTRLTRSNHRPGWDVRSIQPSWAPNGKRLAYVANYYRPTFELLTMNSDGSDTNPLISMDTASITHPCWSPDGERIAFDFGLAIFVAKSDATRRLKLASSFAGDQSSPAWSPDGKRIAFRGRKAGEDTPSWQIFVVDIESGKSRQVTFGGDWNSGSSWSPDGSKLAFVRQEGNSLDLYIINADGADERKVINVFTKTGQEYYPWDCVSWSPFLDECK